jgi:dephospho-CoA kinase
MLNLRKVAVTGGIASGKTAVCRVFQELGAFVVSADAIVHDLLSPGTDISQQVVRLIGSDALKKEGLDRQVIANKVFNDPDALRALEDILHPAVFQRIEELYHEACSCNNCCAFVAEIPLLFEIGHDSFFDCIIVVVSPESLCRERFCQKGFSAEEYGRRMKRQIAPSEKARRADFVINNTGSLDNLKKQVIGFYNQQIARGSFS